MSLPSGDRVDKPTVFGNSWAISDSTQTPVRTGGKHLDRKELGLSN